MYDIAEKEKTVLQSVSAAKDYLRQYPDRTVSLVLSNGKVVSHIDSIKSTQREVYAVYSNGRGRSTLTVSIHSVTAVSHDDAILVSPKNFFRLANSMHAQVMAGLALTDDTNAFVKQIRDYYTDHLTAIGHSKEEIDARTQEGIRERVAQQIRSYYRLDIDSAEWLKDVLMSVGLADLIPNPERDIADLIRDWKPKS